MIAYILFGVGFLFCIAAGFLMPAGTPAWRIFLIITFFTVGTNLLRDSLQMLSYL